MSTIIHVFGGFCDVFVNKCVKCSSCAQESSPVSEGDSSIFHCLFSPLKCKILWNCLNRGLLNILFDE